MQKGFVPVLVLMGILVVLATSVGGYYFYQKNQIKNINSFENCVIAGYPTVESELSPAKCTTPDGRIFTEQSKACTQEAKLCPDGSSVGRTGPNCEFAECPAVKPSPYETTNWKTQTIDLYNLQLSLPSNWTIQEINRRPEPTGPADPKTGHDCADYNIASQEGYVKLVIKPVCGFADGAGSPWPKDAVVVKDLGAEKFLIRFFDKENSVYRYSDTEPVEFSDLQGMHKDNYYNHSIGFDTKDSNTFFWIYVELHYSGPESQKDLFLKDADKVVSSITYLK